MIRMCLRAEKSSKSEVSTDDAPINLSQFSNTTGQSHMLFYYNDYYYYYCCYCLMYMLHLESRIWLDAASLRELITLEKKEEKDPELDNMIAQLGIAEYQVNKLHRILDNRLDRSNPVVFSKGSSTYAFKSGSKKYRITIEADTSDTGERSLPVLLETRWNLQHFLNVYSILSNHLRPSSC